MKRIKYTSVKKTLFHYISIAIISITTFFILLQIQTIEKVFLHDEENIKSTIENTAVAYIHSIDLILSMIEDKTNEKAIDIQNSVIKKYDEKNNWNFSLEEFLDPEEYIDIHIINNDNIIFKSTNKACVNLDFNNNSKMKQVFDKIRLENKSDIDGRGSSLLTGEPMKYIYKSTRDQKYIVEIGIDLNKYAEKLEKTLVINNILKDLKNNKCIFDIAYYDNFGTKYNFFHSSNNSSIHVSKQDLPYFENARDTNSVVSINKKINKKTVTEKYIPYEIVEKSGKISGVIKITYDFSYKNALMIFYIISVIIIGLLWILIITYIIKKKVNILMSPIYKLLNGMNKVSLGEYDTKIAIQTNNEFKILGHNFNNMVKEIKTNKQAVIIQRDEITTLYKQQIATSQQLEESLASNKQTYFETIKALAKAIDAKDHYTNGHCHRVMEYSVSIAKEMGFLDYELDDLKYGALLHDIGKIGIAEDILNKKGKLTDEEFSIIKSHPSIGYDIVKDIDFLSNAKKIIYEHHERIDGCGYPNGLKGDESDIFSRIVCVADSYDAMTSNRAYRKSLSIEHAINELKKGKNTQFDSEVVDAFIRITKSRKITNE